MTEVKLSRLMAMAVVLATLLTLIGAYPAEAAFPGANGNIAFEREGNIWLTGPSGLGTPIDTLLTDLTPNTATSQEVDPAMSPNGRKVAFASDRDGDFEIFTLDIYTGALTKITRNTVRDAQPAWSPDGRRIAFESPNPMAGDEDIFSANADGTGAIVNEVNRTGDQRTPSWSPDGSEIAFVDARFADIAVETLATHAYRQVTTNGIGVQDLLPDWSPDGTRIVFQSDRAVPDRDFEIFTVRSSDGSEIRQLTNNGHDDGNAAYSPDGLRIVYVDFGFGSDQMFTRDSSTGSNAMLIGGFPTNETAPDWGDAVPPPAGCGIGGTFFADTINANNGTNTICSLSGDDGVNARGGSDTLKGGPGRDTLIGSDGRDQLLGGEGRDLLDSRDGVNGNDSLDGGAGRDRCVKDTREASIMSCP
ncbi:MAG: hypothetical protein M3151_11615 [Actinomycetota bacterium]|nr:hypothetical protein [Actinomycetota bacterium]